jgi:hypothetical protein
MKLQNLCWKNEKLILRNFFQRGTKRNLLNESKQTRQTGGFVTVRFIKRLFSLLSVV